MSKGKFLHIRKSCQTDKAIPTSGLPDNATHQISFSLEKNPVLCNTHNIVSNRLSICTLKRFLAIKTQVLPAWESQQDLENCDALWGSMFPRRYLKGQAMHSFLSQSWKCLGCSLAQWSWTDCFEGFGTFLPTGRQMLPSDLHLNTEVGNSKFQPWLFGVWLHTP